MHRADAKEQLILLLYSLIVGVCLSVLYDGFVLLRRLFPKTPTWLVCIEDVVFCLISGFFYFVFIFSANLGVPRLYSFAGSLFGFYLWRLTFSRALVFVLDKSLRFGCRAALRALTFLSTPFLFLLSIITKITKAFLCKTMNYLKMLKYLFIFSKKRDIIYMYIKAEDCFDFESKEEYLKL